MNIPDVARGVTSYLAAAVSLLVGALAVAGCADEQTHLSTVSPLDQQAQLSPDSTALSEVTARGTGCPPGTTNTSISSDGPAFTTTFSSYVTQVDSLTDTTVRDCQLDIRLRNPGGRSYAVKTLSYSGYALLNDGVTGRQTASYAFRSAPVALSDDNRVDLRGPYDRSYAFADDVPAEARAWSPCGVEEGLSVVLRVALTNGSPRRSGYMNMTSLDGSAKLVVELDERACDVSSSTDSEQDAVARVSRVNVQPRSILRNDSFTVSWEVPPENRGVIYRAQLRTPTADGDALFWESPEIDGGLVRYDYASGAFTTDPSTERPLLALEHPCPGMADASSSTRESG